MQRYSQRTREILHRRFLAALPRMSLLLILLSRKVLPMLRKQLPAPLLQNAPTAVFGKASMVRTLNPALGVKPYNTVGGSVRCNTGRAVDTRISA